MQVNSIITIISTPDEPKVLSQPPAQVAIRIMGDRTDSIIYWEDGTIIAPWDTKISIGSQERNHLVIWERKMIV